MSIRITGGTHRGRRLRSARGADLRPTTERVRGAIFSILGPEAVEGARVLDLYAGTGALAIEALSRGAAWADFVEVNAGRARQIRDSLRQISLAGMGRVYQARTQRALDTLPDGYDLVFADPPYDIEVWEPLMGRLGKGDLVREKGLVVVEYRHGLALEERYDTLTRVSVRRYGDTAVSIYSAGAVNG